MSRRRQLLRSAIPLLVLIIIGCKLLGLTAMTAWGRLAFSDERFKVAAQRWEHLERLNIIERDIVYFNVGTAHLQDGNAEGAQDSLRHALKLTPDNRECAVRLNLMLAYELEARRRFDTGDRNGARSVAQRGVDVADEAPRCGQPKSSEDTTKQHVSETRERLMELIERAEEGSNGSSSGDDGNGNDEAPPEDAEQRLQEAAQQAQADRAKAGRGAADSRAPTNTDYDAKTW